MNSRKTERGAKQGRIGSNGARRTLCALMNSRKTECGAAPFAL
jgi:hypothetical protein